MLNRLAQRIGSKETIKLEKCIPNKNSIFYSFSSNLKVFKRKNFFVEYNLNVKEGAESIYAIPFVAAMIPICWALGADIEVPCLDKTFLYSLDKVKEHFQKYFPHWSFSTQIKTQCTQCHFDLLAGPVCRVGLLFSGGLDSLTTYINHDKEKPFLFTMIGADIPLQEHRFIAEFKNAYDSLARAEGIYICYITSDLREIVNEERLKKYAEHWYAEVSHGLLLSTLVAPVSCTFLKTLYIGSCTHGLNSTNICGLSSEIVQSIQWSNTTLRLDSAELTRAEKIRYRFKERRNLYQYLRVCWKQFRQFNCGECEKCLRTICDLLLNNIDPNLCNFNINKNTLKNLKKKILWKYSLFFNDDAVREFWKAIQNNIDLDSLEDYHGSYEFFKWLIGFKKLKEKNNPWIAALASAYLSISSWITNIKALLYRTEPVQ